MESNGDNLVPGTRIHQQPSNPASSGELALSDAELRRIMMRRIARCDALDHASRCPFQLLKGLSYASSLTMVNALKREEMISLLKSECECGNGPGCGLPNNHPAAGLMTGNDDSAIKPSTDRNLSLCLLLLPVYCGLILLVGLMFALVDLMIFLAHQSSRLAGKIFQREQTHGVSGSDGWNKAGQIKARAANT